MTYNILGKLQKTNGNFNYGSFLWQRWIRVTIPIVGSILVTYMVPRLGDGPVWNLMWTSFQPACRHALYVLGSIFCYNNFIFSIEDYTIYTCPLVCKITCLIKIKITVKV